MAVTTLPANGTLTAASSSVDIRNSYKDGISVYAWGEFSEGTLQVLAVFQDMDAVGISETTVEVTDQVLDDDGFLDLGQIAAPTIRLLFTDFTSDDASISYWIGSGGPVAKVKAKASQWVDLSGTVRAAGLAQTIQESDLLRLSMVIQNPSTATEILLVGVGKNATANLTIIAGAAIEVDSNQAIWVQAATLGHAYTAYARYATGDDAP